MAKNITVIDENGNRIGSTYPKRASGLVKKGRAHWIDDNSVCLCAHDMEDKEMPNNIYDVIDNQFSKLQSQIDRIANNDKVAMQMIDALAGMQNRNRTLDIVEKQLNILNEETKAETVSDDKELSVMREKTRQKKLDLLEALVSGKSVDADEKETAVKDAPAQPETTEEIPADTYVIAATE